MGDLCDNTTLKKEVSTTLKVVIIAALDHKDSFDLYVQYNAVSCANSFH